MTRLPVAPHVCLTCGCVVAPVDAVALVLAFAGQTTDRPPGPLHELHERADEDGAYGLTLREHTPRRCAAAAAGDPEPLPPISGATRCHLVILDEDGPGD